MGKLTLSAGGDHDHLCINFLCVIRDLLGWPTHQYFRNRQRFQIKHMGFNKDIQALFGNTLEFIYGCHSGANCDRPRWHWLW